MVDIYHVDLTAGSIHLPYQWSYTDATARLAASGFVSTDVGKLARQVSDNTLWMLTATTPTWVQIGGGSGAADVVNATGRIYASTNFR